MCEYFQHYGIVSHCVWISVISVFPLIYCGLFFAIKNTITTEQGNTQLVLPDIVRVSSSGPAAELYPDSLGEYRLLPDITHNDLPVYKHSIRDDRFIIQNGIHNAFLLINNWNSFAGYHWFITHEISNSGLREFSSFRAERGHLVTSQGWKYNKYPNCKTVRWG